MIAMLKRCGLGVALIAVSTLVGCNANRDGGHDHEHEHDHDHAHAHAEPDSFVAAVAEVKEHADEIGQAFTAEQPEEAHDALHEIGHLLESLPGLAGKAGLSDQQVADTKAASVKLFEQYSTLDDSLHGKGEVSYEDVAAEIDSNLQTLQGLASAASAQASPAKHDHGHDHDHPANK